MSGPRVRVPARVKDQKPPHGAPCNNCGLCCMASLCRTAQHVFRRPALPGPCPALTKTETGYGCGLIIDPAKHAPARALAVGAQQLSEAARWLIGSGTGCDARFDGEPTDLDFYARLAAWDVEHEAVVRRSLRTWGAE